MSSTPQILTGIAPAMPTTAGGPARAGAAGFSAQPGATFDAEVVQVQATTTEDAALSRLQTQVMLRLGNTLIAATLPGPQPQVGARLPLVYLGSQNGQAQFLFAPQQQQGAVRSQLSGAGQLLGVLQRAGATDVPQQRANAASDATPVWSDPAQPPAQAAQTLARALGSSGLFYESHLGAWAQGQRALSDLLGEPQGRLSPLLQQTDSVRQSGLAPRVDASTTTASSQPRPDVASPAASVPGTAQRTVQAEVRTIAAGLPQPQAPDAVVASPRHAGLAVYAGVQTAPQVAADPAALAARLPAELHGMVQQQLQALMQGQVVWQGAIWPGQTARWTIRPETNDGAQKGVQRSGHNWVTVLDLDLPHLGPVQARLRLHGNSIDLSLQRGHAAQAAIDPALPSLHKAFQSAGLEVGGLQVHAPGAAAA